MGLCQRHDSGDMSVVAPPGARQSLVLVIPAPTRAEEDLVPWFFETQASGSRRCCPATARCRWRRRC